MESSSPIGPATASVLPPRTSATRWRSSFCSGPSAAPLGAEIWEIGEIWEIWGLWIARTLLESTVFERKGFINMGTFKKKQCFSFKVQPTEQNPPFRCSNQNHRTISKPNTNVPGFQCIQTFQVCSSTRCWKTSTVLKGSGFISIESQYPGGFTHLIFSIQSGMIANLTARNHPSDKHSKNIQPFVSMFGWYLISWPHFVWPARNSGRLRDSSQRWKRGTCWSAESRYCDDLVGGCKVKSGWRAFMTFYE